jgi:Secretion system C-terminal sorting domain
LKYDRDGNQQWAKIYDAPGNGDNHLEAIAMDRRNNVLFVTGNAHANGINVAATIKYNASTGDSVWVRRYNESAGGSGAGDIKVDTSGNAYITGGIPNGSTGDVLTLKYSPAGNVVWFVTYNGPYNGADGGHALELDNLNNIYVLGTSQSGFQVGDYIVIKYSQLVGIRPISNEIPKEFRLYQNYPNPFNPSSKFKIQIPKLSVIMLKIYDILGREVGNPINERLRTGTYEATFDGANYPSGVYFYRLIADGSIIETKKLILLK